MDLLPENLSKHVGNLSFNQICTIFRQSLELIATMHENDLLHGDLKPQNMIFNLTTNHLTIIDMDLSENLKKSPREKKPFGTDYYLAPELILGQGQYGTDIDIWSLACTLFELVTGEHLFNVSCYKNPLPFIIAEMGIPPKEVLNLLKKTGFYFKKNVNGKYEFKDKLPPSLRPWKVRMREAGDKHKYLSSQTESLIDLIDKMLQYTNRITAKEALSHTLFKKDRRFQIVVEGLPKPASYELRLVNKTSKKTKEYLSVNLSLSAATLSCLHVPVKNTYTLRIKHIGTKPFLLQRKVKIPSNSEIHIKATSLKYANVKIIKPPKEASQPLRHDTTVLTHS